MQVTVVKVDAMIAQGAPPTVTETVLLSSGRDESGNPVPVRVSSVPPVRGVNIVCQGPKPLRVTRTVRTRTVRTKAAAGDQNSELKQILPTTETVHYPPAVDPTLGDTEATVGYSWKVWGWVPVESAMYALRSTTGAPAWCADEGQGECMEGMGLVWMAWSWTYLRAWKLRSVSRR